MSQGCLVCGGCGTDGRNRIAKLLILSLEDPDRINLLLSKDSLCQSPLFTALLSSSKLISIATALFVSQRSGLLLSLPWYPRHSSPTDSQHLLIFYPT